MKTSRFVSLSVFLVVLLSLAIAPDAALSSGGETFYQQAQRLEKKVDLFKALEKYKLAKAQFVKEGNVKRVSQCRAAFTRIECVKMTYPYTEEQVRAMIRKKYPDVTVTRLDEVIRDGRLPQLAIGGRTYYFMDFTNTLYHIYPDFRSREESGALGKGSGLIEAMSRYIHPKGSYPPGQTLSNPITYLAEGEITIPRSKLPDKGLLKVWLPLPLVTAAQPNVEILSIQPEKYLVYPIRLDGDIALAYMEIPLRELREDLKIGTKFRFMHYEERFEVAPTGIGSYDRKSELYKRYTASRGHIAVTPAIRAKAKRLAGKETNPYRIAKKFYDHIVYDLDYSFTPHGAMEPLGIPESVYVHEHGYGDCGAQSMYFAALCRAVGIPARAAGGMQLFPIGEKGCGDHFWAQFYLPNYGWIPVDTSAGQIIKYMKGPTDKQKRDFIEYFFSKMDPFRYLIQVDVDIPFIPKPEQPPVFAAVLQQPTGECAEMDDHAGFLFDQWNIKIKQVKAAEEPAKQAAKR